MSALREINELLVLASFCRSPVGQSLYPLCYVESMFKKEFGWYKNTWNKHFIKYFSTESDYYSYYYGHSKKQIVIDSQVLDRCPYHPSVIAEGGVIKFSP